MRLEFTKYEGTANDFLVVDAAALGAHVLSTDEVVALCDRHRGVGGDGVLVVGWDGARGSMRVVNADGSVPEMCGNGLRCVAAHLVRTGRAGESFVVDTDAGPHRCRVERRGAELEVEIEMRVPSLAPAEVPVVSDAPLRDAVLEVDGRSLHFTAVSMGNPHAVTFDAVGDDRLALGPRVERDPRFPSGVNVGFASLRDGGLALDVYERGAGWTQACGTGACAAAVAAVETGRLPRGATIPVTLPGGTLQITVGAVGERVHLRGPARFVFDGTVSLASERASA